MTFRVSLFATLLFSLATAAYCDEPLSVRKQSVLDVYSRVTDFSYNAKSGPFEVLAITAAKGCMKPRLPSYMAQVLNLGPKQQDGNLSFEMFSLSPLARYLFMYGSCMSADDVSAIKSTLSSAKIDVTAHGTLNHAIMQASSWYLIAQYFPDVTWNLRDGKKISSQQVMDLLKPLLLSRSAGFALSGYYEQSSPTYAMVNYFPLLNLIDFAKDEQVRQSAEREAIVILALLKANSFHGRLVPPLTRNTHAQKIAEGFKSVNAFPAVTQHLLWYYFGEPSLSLFDLRNKREPFYLIMLALSKWTAPFSAAPFSQEYLGSFNTPTFSIWGKNAPREFYGRLYIAKDFAIGAGNSELNPGGYNEDNVSFGILFKDNKSYGLIDCYHPYYRSNSGQFAWENDRSSPFEEIYLNGRDGMIVFDIPEKDPFKYDQKNSGYMKRNQNADSMFQVVNCRVPSDSTEVKVQNGTIYFNKDGIFVAIKAAHGEFAAHEVRNPEMIGWSAFTVSARKNALYFKVGGPQEFGSFDEFKRYIGTKAIFQTEDGFAFTGDDEKRTEVRYSSESAGNNRLRLLPEVFKDGQRLDMTDPAVVRTPNISLEGGRLQLKCNGNEVVQLQVGKEVPKFPVPCRL